MLKNYMEHVVDRLLPKVLYQHEDICRCDKCIEDIKAITLNNLKPMYIVTDKGSVYSKVNELELQFRANVLKELVKAIKIVSQNPKHE